MTTIERESAVIERMKLEVELGALRIENTKLRADKELLLKQLFDCLQALIRSERRQHEPVGHLEPLPGRHATRDHSGLHSAHHRTGKTGEGS